MLIDIYDKINLPTPYVKEISTQIIRTFASTDLPRKDVIDPYVLDLKRASEAESRLQ